MMCVRLLTVCAVLFCGSYDPVAAIDPERLNRIDDAVAQAITRKECPGAVVVVVHKDKVVFRKAYGDRVRGDQVEPLTPDTIFDMASLTKPVATGTSILSLVEAGKLRFSDPVAKYWPEFAANGKDKITIEECLIHTTGLTPDNSIRDYTGSRKEMLDRIAALKLDYPTGTRFRYSDVGFIVLGELVERVSGMPLDEYAQKHVFAPLGMKDTGFRPAKEQVPRVAPTGKRNSTMIRGEVHDPRAYALGGVAGHAGLFSTADDMARYARMLLRKGELDGQRILGALTVQHFTEPVDVPGGSRSRGWDVDTGYSSPRGELFPAGMGFGHTGFTGTSLWIVPEAETAIIILTSRLYPDEKGNATPLRRQVATIVASALPEGIQAPPRRGNRRGQAVVLPGVDVLVQEQFKSLAGRKIGLVTNHTGRSLDGVSTIDLLAQAEGVKLVALFSPEHGIRGEKDEKVGDGKDEKTGLPIFSLYGERRKPTPETLAGIDTLVYDIQDIGCRFYTYSSTLKLILEAGAENKIRVVVLDRPNPLGGVEVAGPMLDPGREAFVAAHALPLRHGMTVGELATIFKAERSLDVDLQVVKVAGWNRADTFERTGLPWINPSPNMRHLTAAMLYPGVGLLETTNISVGRGTERPFEWIGAPWVDGRKLARDLNRRNLPGVRFVPVSRTPITSVHKDKVCGGVDIIVTDWARLEPVRVGLTIAEVLRKEFPEGWNPKSYDRLLIHKATYEGIINGKPASELIANWEAGTEAYRASRKKFFLYD